jgi:hypothetical protein
MAPLYRPGDLRREETFVGSSLLKPPGSSPAGGSRSSSGAPSGQVGKGRRLLATNTPDRSLLAAATIVILALTFLGVLLSVYSIASFNTRSVDKPIIPVWEPADEEQAAEQTEDADTPTPTLSSSPTQSETSEATEETAIDPLTGEVVEAALREPFAEGPTKADEATKRDDLPSAAFENPAARPADSALHGVESTSTENTITSQDPALTSTNQYPDVTAQPLPPQTSPTDSPMGAGTSPQPPVPLDETIPSGSPADSPPLAGNL